GIRDDLVTGVQTCALPICNGGDAIYAVPGRSASLAHAVRAADLVQLTPVAYNDIALKPYLAALDDPSLPLADLRWQTPSTVTIRSEERRVGKEWSAELCAA